MSQIVVIAAFVIISIIGNVLTFSIIQQQVLGQEAFTADELPPVRSKWGMEVRYRLYGEWKYVSERS